MGPVVHATTSIDIVCNKIFFSKLDHYIYQLHIVVIGRGMWAHFNGELGLRFLVEIRSTFFELGYLKHFASVALLIS